MSTAQSVGTQGTDPYAQALAKCTIEAVCFAGAGSSITISPFDVATYLGQALPSCLPTCGFEPPKSCCTSGTTGQCGSCATGGASTSCYYQQNFVDGYGSQITSSLPTVWVVSASVDLSTGGGSSACLCPGGTGGSGETAQTSTSTESTSLQSQNQGSTTSSSTVTNADGSTTTTTTTNVDISTTNPDTGSSSRVASRVSNTLPGGSGVTGGTGSGVENTQGGQQTFQGEAPVEAPLQQTQQTQQVQFDQSQVQQQQAQFVQEGGSQGQGTTTVIIEQPSNSQMPGIIFGPGV